MSVLPPTIAPRGLTIEQAAEYCGVSVATLERHGPAPTKVGGRNVWDRKVLDLWLDRLAGIAPKSDARTELRQAINARKDTLRHAAG